MSGALLDTHAILWLYDPAPISVAALIAVDSAERANSLYISPVSAWEIGAASRKKSLAKRPAPPEDWFLQARLGLGAIPLPLDEAIGIAACSLPNLYGYADPGDCFLIASAHIYRLTLITRDKRILNFAKANPDYLSVVAC